MSSFYQKTGQCENLLALLAKSQTADVIELCKLCFEYLTNSAANAKVKQRCELLSQRYASDTGTVLSALEALIALLIDASASGETEIKRLLLRREVDDETAAKSVERVSAEVLDVLTQFISNKRRLVEGSIKSANIRAYRLVNLEWRLEVRVASRSLLRQSNVCVTMKLYLHTEPKNENRDLLLSDADEGEEQKSNMIHPDEKRNRRDLLVQTDLSSLLHIIQSLEDALIESRSRRIRNIVEAIH